MARTDDSCKMHRWCGAVRPHWPHISGRISASCVDMGCAAAGRGGAPGSAPNDMVRVGAEIGEGQKEEKTKDLQLEKHGPSSGA